MGSEKMTCRQIITNVYRLPSWIYITSKSKQCKPALRGKRGSNPVHSIFFFVVFILTWGELTSGVDKRHVI